MEFRKSTLSCAPASKPRANSELQLMAVFCFIVWYFPIGFYKNAEFTDTVDSRNVTTFLFVWLLLAFTSTFAHMLIAGFESDEVAGALGTLFLIMMFTFNG